MSYCAAQRSESSLCSSSARRKSDAAELGPSVSGANGEHICDLALRLDRPRVERQCSLVQRERLCKCITRLHACFPICGACSEKVIERVGIVGRRGSFPARQLDIECNSDTAGDLILQSEQIAYIAVELLSPQMYIALGVDQLGIDA